MQQNLKVGTPVCVVINRPGDRDSFPGVIVGKTTHGWFIQGAEKGLNAARSNPEWFSAHSRMVSVRPVEVA